MGQACEMCGRSIRAVYHNEHYASPFGQSGHIRGGGDGWVVLHRQDQRLINMSPIFHTIITCGDTICVWRARYHGVPGAVP